MTKQIAVIGAGPGGLAAAMLLASKGYDVQVYEKQPFIGGRNAALQLGEFTFDRGPTFLSMIHIVEELFGAARRNVYDYLKLIELDPMYQLIFEDKTLNMTRNPASMKKQIEQHFPGNNTGYDRFVKETSRKMEVLAPILQSKMDRFFQLFSPKVIRALPELELGRSLYDVLSRYFSDDQLIFAFTFQSKYLGMSPWECPGAFAILSYMEHAYGVYHPIGGLNQLTKAMAKVVREYGGTIYTGEGVKQLLIKNRKIQGLLLDNGEKVHADEVIINGDFAHVMTNLIEPGVLSKYTPEKLEQKKYSCSTFMIYAGLDKIYHLPHHTIVFSNDYRKNIEEITTSKTLSRDPSIYIQNAGVTDPTLAPEGKSGLYILAPVPNNFSRIDWEKDRTVFRDLVLETMEKKTGFKNLSAHIETETIFTPMNWEQDMFVYKGATFNLGHQLSQMMVFRPHNQFEELGHCWLVGGGTHPGSGLPTILESARITVNGILERDRQEKIPAGPLPAVEAWR
ncbi:MAG: phytoene desaturase [Bacillaceae bacterium]|nr:phytoene desaturase [Bacillaceae bacterium]